MSPAHPFLAQANFASGLTSFALMRRLFEIRNHKSTFQLRFGREGLFGKLMLQKPGVTNEGGVEGGSGDIKARKAIEKAKANKVSPEKTPEGPKGSLGRRPLCFFL